MRGEQPIKSTAIITSPLNLDFDYKVRLFQKILLISAISSLVFALMQSLELNDIGELQAKADYLFSTLLLVLSYKLKKNVDNFQTIFFCFLVVAFLLALTALVCVPGDTFRAIWFFFTDAISVYVWW